MNEDEVTLEPVGEKTVRYSDIDTNRHLNNTHYCDLYCDHLPMEGKRVAALSVAFLKEAPLGETVTVLRTEAPDENGVYYFRTVRCSDGAVNTEAMVLLTDL
jgi:acyl-ACP thioesterase